MLITHLTIAGDAAIIAEDGTDLDSGIRSVRLYLGDAITITMPVNVADAVGDALADVDSVVTLPHLTRK